MPVTLNKKNKFATLQCEECGKKENFTYSSPAAPELTACEKAGKSGWAYTIGFWVMFLGHQVLCPDCNKGEKNE